jgi:hypothetical protein
VRAERYEHQVDWETAARAAATCVLFWIPRDVRSLPGRTTNVEFGLDAGTGRAVLGCPPDCPNPERNRYLAYVAYRLGVPVAESLSATVSAALAIVRKPQLEVSAAAPASTERIMYGERAALLAYLVACHQANAVIVLDDPSEPGMALLYLQTIAGQMSWHIHPDDLPYFDRVPQVSAADGPVWDQHTTDEKYRRLDELTRRTWDARR